MEFIAQGLSTKKWRSISILRLVRWIAACRKRAPEIAGENRTHMVACAVMEGLLQVKVDRDKHSAPSAFPQMGMSEFDD